MAALRQLLSARAMVANQPQERSSPSPSEEELRRNEAKVMAYSNPPPAIPSKSQSTSKASSEQPRQLHSKFNDVDNESWQHPLLRKNPSSTQLDNSYNRSTSFDQGNSYNRPQPSRSQTETNLLSVDGSELDRSSFYEENESPALSPALNKHLALRPLNTQAPAPAQPYQEQHPYNSPSKSHTRRRSRSATQDGYYGAGENAWDGYGSKTHKPRQDSLQGAKPSSDPEQGSGVMQLLRDRQVRTPQPDQNVRAIIIKTAPLPAQAPSLIKPSPQGRFDPQPLDMIGAKAGGARKEAHTFTNSDNSPTDSMKSTSSRQNESRNHKRQRSLDYTPHQLAQMDYATLHAESFDHIPSTDPQKLAQQNNLPAPTLPLRERLHYIYPDKTHKDKAHRARIFFSSLSIDQYEECGDLLLDGFKDIMERLKQARQQKRKAARSMEDQIAKREEWVRRKRGILEMDLGRLKTSGAAVVKPVKKANRS